MRDYRIAREGISCKEAFGHANVITQANHPYHRAARGPGNHSCDHCQWIGRKYHRNVESVFHRHHPGSDSLGLVQALQGMLSGFQGDCTFAGQASTGGRIFAGSIPR
jgi:hypothetical protein